ncbi:hypothetical protein LCGC14_2529770 [marine sediment metagenome]|uniref:Uncharacterized protein n=1 Tax=marine sediment metagenome TaxID=412755 RepID=A0A0F9DM16_9ZZZZ
MNEKVIDRHSVNCYFCGDLVDERESVKMLINTTMATAVLYAKCV